MLTFGQAACSRPLGATGDHPKKGGLRLALHLALRPFAVAQRPRGLVIPAKAGTYPIEARKRRNPPLPIRGEDAANAAGEGTADEA